MSVLYVPEWTTQRALVHFRLPTVGQRPLPRLAFGDAALLGLVADPATWATLEPLNALFGVPVEARTFVVTFQSDLASRIGTCLLYTSDAADE